MKRLLFAPALLIALRRRLAPAHAEAPPKPVVVPFELLPSGHMTVMVKVNGEGPYRLILDTGAPITLIDNKVAKAAGLLKDVPAAVVHDLRLQGRGQGAGIAGRRRRR